MTPQVSPTFIFEFIVSLWWLWAFVILLPFAKDTWIAWRQELFEASELSKYIILEILVPREIHKNPKAMQQVLFALHGLRNTAGHLREYWWDGEITRWFSLEIVSFGGEVHFYIRCPKKQRGLVEAAFYGYYQDIALKDNGDYLDRLPVTVGEMYAQGYDLWASEMLLTQSPGYPIKTYEEFESPDEESQYDPMSAFLEVLSKVKKEEFVGIQYIIAPLHNDWRKSYEKLVEELRSKAQITARELAGENEKQ